MGRQIPVKGSWNELLFCIRDSDNVMRTSKLSVNVLGSLLAVMEDTYVDMIINNTSWPDSVRKDFTAQVHKFMANLTESVHSLKGKTVLYIPGEDVSDAQAVAREKDLVQRLESTLIHWTRQIKEVVNNQDNSSPARHLLAQLPPAWSLEDVMKSKADDPSALHVVLFQEIERYNVLINKIRLSCQQLQKGIKGLVVMSSTTSSRPSSTGACRPSGSRRTRH